MGQPKSLKHNGPEGQSGRRLEGLPKRTSSHSSASSARLSDRSTRFRHQPSPSGLSNRKAWPKTRLPTPTPRPGLVGTLLTALLRPAHSDPTGAIRPGAPRSEGTRRRAEKGKAWLTRQNHCTRDHTLYKTVLCSHPNTKYCRGRYGKPPACLWTKIAVWAPGFAVPGEHSAAPHMPLGIKKYFCRHRRHPS